MDGAISLIVVFFITTYLFCLTMKLTLIDENDSNKIDPLPDDEDDHVK
jgi:hypothetical protein